MGGLASQRGSLAMDLPGGLRQRLALACAVIHRPPVLFLDEPTAGVDPISRREFWDLIRTMAAAGTAILVTTHYMDEAEQCHTLAFIYQGRIIANGPPARLKANLKGCLLEIQVPPDALVPTLKTLQAYPDASEVAMFGTSLHVTLGSREAVPALCAFLESKGTVEAEVETIVPSLEDVFVSLVTRESSA